MHLAFSPVFLGSGEHLFTGPDSYRVDLPKLGFTETQTLYGKRATHVILKRTGWGWNEKSILNWWLTTGQPETGHPATKCAISMTEKTKIPMISPHESSREQPLNCRVQPPTKFNISSPLFNQSWRANTKSVEQQPPKKTGASEKPHE